jgi:hypothetical protein
MEFLSIDVLAGTRQGQALSLFKYCVENYATMIKPLFL